MTDHPKDTAPVVPGASAEQTDCSPNASPEREPVTLKFTPRDRSKVEAACSRGDRVCFKNVIDPAKEQDRAKFLENATKACGLSPKENADLRAQLLSVDQRKLRAQPMNKSREELLRDRDAVVAAKLATTDPAILAKALALLKDPCLVQKLAGSLQAAGIVGEDQLALTLYLVGTSRLLPKPLGALIQGCSSSGKSFVMKRVAAFFPPEAVLDATDITPQALYYFQPPGRLMHILVMAGERPRGDAEARAERTRALRELLSSGELRKVVTEKGPDGGQQTREVYQYGPIAYVDSSTNAREFGEDMNRVLLLATDQSPEQTRRILDAEALTAAHLPEERKNLAVLVTAQRLLKRVVVRIPFAVLIAQVVPVDAPQARRAIGQILSLIKVIALLHQYQRTERPEHGTEIVATVEDYAIARELLLSPLGRSLGLGLKPSEKGYALGLYATFGLSQFTIPQAEALGVNEVRSPSPIHRHVSKLVERGLIERVSERSGRIPATYRLSCHPDTVRADWLITPETLRDRIGQDGAGEGDAASAGSPEAAKEERTLSLPHAARGHNGEAPPAEAGSPPLPRAGRGDNGDVERTPGGAPERPGEPRTSSDVRFPENPGETSYAHEAIGSEEPQRRETH